MKRLQSFSLFTVFLAAGFVALLSAAARPEETRWKLIGKSETETQWYIDTETISRPTETSVSVWVKSIPDKLHADEPEGTESTEAILKRIQERYFGDYDRTEALWELDCSRAMFRLLYFCAYSRNGEPLVSILTPDAEWSFILPKSAGESVREAVCGLNR